MHYSELSIGSGDVLYDVAAQLKTEHLQIKNSTHNVGIADERFVIKTPKSTKNMASLAVEAAALKIVEQAGPLSAATPHIVEFSSDPVFLVTTYLPGRVIEAASLHELTTKEREILGRDIGAFVLSQIQQIDSETVRRDLPPHGDEDTWESIFAASIGNFSSESFPSVTRLARALYTQWLGLKTDCADEHFIQGDLRLGNMAVSEDNRLHGVFDFGRAGIGTTSNEISPLIYLDPIIMQGAVAELQSASLDIDMNQAATWDEAKKLTMLIRYITNGHYRDNPPVYVKRACRILATRYPDLPWDEFNQLKVTRGDMDTL